MASLQIRPLTRLDNPQIAEVIRAVMPEFGAQGPGFAIHDPEVDAMHAAYSLVRAAYFVVEEDNRVVGGAGYAVLEGGDRDICELRKMYFLPELRGRGVGADILKFVLAQAAAAGFRRCYLETLTGMDAAKTLYRRFGFETLDGPLGCTGHFGCDTWMIRDLD
ncbi:MAG: GNAT family N-acetyltransferase [Planctomycetota bacterium]